MTGQPRRNDLALLARLQAAGRLALTPGALVELEVRHERTCPLLQGQADCICKPEFWLEGKRVDDPAARTG